MTNNLQNKQDVQEIDLLKLLKVLWSKIWVIAAAAFVGGVLFFVYTLFFIVPLYKSSALLYVNNNSLSIGSSKVNITSGDINASNSLIDTYVVILKSRTTLEKAIKEGELPFTYEQLRSKVSGSSEGNTPVFKITVTDEDPEMAANVCNRIVEIMIDQNSGISGIVEGSSVSVIDYAVVARSASSPSYTKNTAIGMLLGFVIACGIVILRSLMDSTIREEEFLLDKYKDIPVLATIPDLLEASQSGYYGYGGYGGSYSKSYAQASANARRPGNATSDISSEGSSKQEKGSEV